MNLKVIFEKIIQHKILALTVLATIITLPIIIIQVQNQQSLRQRASETSGVSMQFIPEESTIGIGNNLEITLTLSNPEQKKISAIDFTISYDYNLLDFVNLSPSSELNSFESIPTNFTQSSYHYVGVNTSDNLSSNNFINLGIITFKAKSAGAAIANFPTIHINASGIHDALPVDIANTKGGKYTIINSVVNSPTSPSLSPTLGPTSVAPNVPTLIPPIPTDIPTLIPTIANSQSGSCLVIVPSSQQGKFSIYGIVNGQPNVNITLSGHTLDSTLTDSCGRYSFSNLESSNYNVSVGGNSQSVSQLTQDTRIDF